MQRRTALTSIIGLSLLAAAACGSGTDSSDGGGDGSGADGEPWRFGVLPCSADCGFLRMAQEQGLYEEFGVNVELVELNSAAQIYPALAAGEVDAIEQSPGGLFIGVEQSGMEATIIGSTMQGLPYAIYGSDDLTDLSELDGHSMAISSPTGMPALVAELMLEDAGVDWGSVQVVNAGGNVDRFRAVVAGTADAASSPADYVPMAEDEGVNVLALSSDVIPEFPRYMIIARNESLENRPEDAARFLAANTAGLRYALENPDEAMSISAEALGTTPDDPQVTALHELVIDSDLIDPDGGIPMSMLEYLEQALIDTGQLGGTLDLDTIVDDSYHQEALELVDNS